MTAGAPLFDLDALRGRLDDCADAGLMHPLGLRAVHTGPDALLRLAQMVGDLLRPERGGEVALLTDARPKWRAGEEVSELVRRLLTTFDVHGVVLGDPQGRVHADPATIDSAVRGTAGARCLVTVASGTVADIGKVAAARHGIPHLVVQTATSVNGFADDQSVLLIDGVKRTTSSGWPDVLVIDTELIRGAPVPLNLAGIGDLAAMFTAPADWSLAFQLGMCDSYSPTAVALSREHGEVVRESAAGVARGEPSAIERVATTLTLSGISMGVAGTTAPSSGMEHTVSHLIDMAANQRGHDAALHGAQVGVASVAAAALWDRLLDHLRGGRAHLRVPTEREMSSRVLSAFAALDPTGAMGEECWRLYSRKLERWASVYHRVQAIDWEAVISSLRPLLIDPAALAAALSAGGAPARFADLDPPVDAATVRWAMLNCHLMRDRFTVADLAFLVGMWEPEDVDVTLSAATVEAGP